MSRSWGCLKRALSHKVHDDRQRGRRLRRLRGLFAFVLPGFRRRAPGNVCGSLDPARVQYQRNILENPPLYRMTKPVGVTEEKGWDASCLRSL